MRGYFDPLPMRCASACATRRTTVPGMLAGEVLPKVRARAPGRPREKLLLPRIEYGAEVRKAPAAGRPARSIRRR